MKNKIKKVKITTTGVSPLMFDRFSGDLKVSLKPEQKMYFGPDGKTLVMPSINIMSFLSSQNTNSAPKMLLKSKDYKKVAQHLLSYTWLEDEYSPITRNGKPIKFGKFENERDSLSGVFIDKRAARLPGGIPNPKERPVLPKPWEISFVLNYFENETVTLDLVELLFEQGGMAIGFGTFRGVFGKFKLTKWEELN
jgi:hypothetical protein